MELSAHSVDKSLHSLILPSHQLSYIGPIYLGDCNSNYTNKAQYHKAKLILSIVNIEHSIHSVYLHYLHYITLHYTYYFTYITLCYCFLAIVILLFTLYYLSCLWLWLLGNKGDKGNGDHLYCPKVIKEN